MKLFYAPNTISIASAIALDEAGITYEPVRVDFSTGEQTKPAYHAINPKGRVPALVTDDGILTETGAILEHIAALKPDAGLVPSDPWRAAHMRAAMYYLASTMHVNHAHKLRGHRWADLEASRADMTAKVAQTMTESCTYIEENVADRTLRDGQRSHHRRSPTSTWSVPGWKATESRSEIFRRSWPSGMRCAPACR